MISFDEGPHLMGRGPSSATAKAPPPLVSRPQRSLSRAALATPAAILALGCLAVFIVTPLDLRTQFALALGSGAVSLLVARSENFVATLALVLVSATATGRYLYWRLTTTIGGEWSLDAALGGLLLAAELYSCAMLVLAYAQSVAGLRRKPLPLPDDLAQWPSVDVFIPTYNEALEIVRATVLAAAAIDWPADRLRIYLLDDGRRAPFRAFAQEAGVGYIVRPDNRHAKAGNLNHALEVTRGEFIAIFDCDHVPARSFLQVTMGWLLRDPNLALVQTPHHFYSPDPFSRNLGTEAQVPSESQLFYGVIQPGIDTWNATFFCGSCAVLRRRALEQVGGIAVETVTEDAHTALKMHRRGWGTAYLEVPQAAGLATETLSAHVGQRIRWARGMAQIFRVDCPLFGRGLKLSQRLSYLAAMLHFFSGLPRLVFLLAPVAYLGFGRHIFNALPLAALAYGLPHLVHSTACNTRIHGRFRHSFWSDVYETCLAVYIAIPTTVALFAPRAGSFNVTAKGGRIDAPFFDAKIARPFLALAAINLAAIGAGLWKLKTLHGDLDSLTINVTWAGYNLVLLAGCIACACERPQTRAGHRVAAQLPAMLRMGDGRTARCETRDLGRDGAAVQVGASIQVRARERVWLSIFSFADERPLPAEVVEQDGDAVRVQFLTLSLEEERALVQAIFSRADAWLGWTDGHQRDRPLVTLGRIAKHGAAGLGRAAALALRWRPAPLRRLPAAARSEL